jgi:hypothetical protein
MNGTIAPSKFDVQYSVSVKDIEIDKQLEVDMKIKDLELRINYLNKLTKNRVEKYLPYKIDSKLISNKGHYYLSQYNSSYGVEQIVNTMGGCTDVSYRGS